MDDEAEAPRGDSNIDDLFDLTEDDEDATSSVDDVLFSDSDDESNRYSLNGPATVANDVTGAIDVCHQVSVQQRKILKPFNAPGYPQYPLSPWSLTVSNVSSDIAHPSLDAVSQSRWDLHGSWKESPLVTSARGFPDFPTSPDACKVLTLLSSHSL